MQRADHLIHLETLPPPRSLNSVLAPEWAGFPAALTLADALEGHAIAAAYKLGAVEGIRSSRGVNGTAPVSATY